jgi:vitamin B12 transporter
MFFVLSVVTFPILAADSEAPKPEAAPSPKPTPTPGAKTGTTPAKEETAAPKTGTAEAPKELPDELVVTASRVETTPEKTGVSISVIDGKEDRDTHQNTQLSESLRNVPGLNVSRGGLPGDFTSLFTRGGNSNQTLFLQDGFKVNRQGGNYNLSAADPVLQDRIEVARGPASSLYGTDAVTGAVNVITAKGEGAPDVTASAAGGTYGIDRETLSSQGQAGKFSYNVGSARMHRQDGPFNNSELETYNYAGRFDFQVNKEHALKVVVRGTDFHKGFYEDTATGYGPSVEPSDPNDTLSSRDLLAGLEYTGEILPIWTTKLRLGHYSFDQRIVSRELNPESPVGGFAQSTGKTHSQENRPTLDWQNDFTAFNTEDGKIKNIVTIGANVEQESFEQKDTQFGSNADIKRTNWSVFMQNRLDLYDRAFITAGVRREENEQFGDFLTARADASILIPESGSRIHGSVGNAFRAPSFYEAYSAFGNANLQPEENFAYDAGLDQHFWDKRIKMGATYFHNSFKDLVDFSFDTNTFDNLKTARTSGIESELEIKPIKHITLRGTATFIQTEDAAGDRLLRRPANTYTAQVIAHPIKDFNISVEMLRVGGRVDLGPSADSAFDRVHNNAYVRVDTAASYRFLSHWRVFGRVENVLNADYEDVKTFPSAGVNVLGGIEFHWKFK